MKGLGLVFKFECIIHFTEIKMKHFCILYSFNLKNIRKKERNANGNRCCMDKACNKKVIIVVFRGAIYLCFMLCCIS